MGVNICKWSDPQEIVKMYKQLMQLNIQKKKKTPIKTSQLYIDISPVKDIQMDKKHMKRC